MINDDIKKMEKEKNKIENELDKILKLKKLNSFIKAKLTN